jgi:hypothetical protein
MGDVLKKLFSWDCFLGKPGCTISLISPYLNWFEKGIWIKNNFNSWDIPAV